MRTRAHTPTHACTHTIYAYVRTHKHTHACTNKHMRTHARARTHAHAHSRSRTRMHAHAHKDAGTHARTRTHLCTHTHTHTCTHTHTGTRTRAQHMALLRVECTSKVVPSTPFVLVLLRVKLNVAQNRFSRSLSSHVSGVFPAEIRIEKTVWQYTVLQMTVFTPLSLPSCTNILVQPIYWCNQYIGATNILVQPIYWCNIGATG